VGQPAISNSDRANSVKVIVTAFWNAVREERKLYKSLKTTLD